MQIHALRTEAELALVASDGEVARNAGRKGWSLAKGAETKRIVVVRLSACELAIRCELSGASGPLDPGNHKRVLSHIRHLHKADLPWTTAAARLADAQMAALDGNASAALAGFDRAIGLFAAQEMRLHAEAARYRRGCLLGGEAGRVDRTRAVKWAERQGAVAPLRLFRMIAPAVDGLHARRR